MAVKDTFSLESSSGKINKLDFASSKLSFLFIYFFNFVGKQQK